MVLARLVLVLVRQEGLRGHGGAAGRGVGGVCMSYISYVCDEPVGQCLAPMLLDLSIF